RVLSVSIANTGAADRIELGLRDSSGNEHKVAVRPDHMTQMSGKWRQIEIPLAAFSDIQLSSVAGVLVAIGSAKPAPGQLMIDDIVLDVDSEEVLVDDFGDDAPTNRLGGEQRTFTEGAAAISAAVGAAADQTLRLSYGGSIGELFTYAGWQTDLRGMSL